MSALELITVELSPCEKVQILRSELEDRQAELLQIAADIRTKLQAIETQRYLESLSPYYAANIPEELPTREEIEAMEVRRTQLHELVHNIEATIPVLLESKEGAAASPAVASPAAGPARKAKFDSFDDFKAAKK